MGAKIKWFWSTATMHEWHGQFVECEQWRDNASSAAEVAASYYHDNHDGWEDKWPIEFSVRRDGASKWETFEVDREAVPHFHATRKSAT